MLYEKTGIGETLYLISAFDRENLYIVTMQFPTEENTIAEYEEWKQQSVKNAIPLCNDFVPQTIPHYSIRDFTSLDSIFQHACDDCAVETQQIIDPYFGNVIGFDFRELLKLLYEQKTSDFWKARRTIKKYYEQLILAWVNK